MTNLLEGTLPADAAPKTRRGELERQPLLYVLLEGDRPLALSTRHSLASTDTVLIGRAPARRAEREGKTLRIGLPDPWMSSSHAALRRSNGRWILEDLGSRNGSKLGETSVERRALNDGDLIEVGHTVLVFRERVEMLSDDSRDLECASTLPAAPGLLTAVPSVARELEVLRQIARADVGIVLLGESGTGKEMIAKAIAKLSRRKGAFVGINCGGIPDQLIESEMFGVVKGAFTGASADRLGLVRSADGGTLFLDEIADLPGASQAALLRVLQERRVRPVGGTRDVAVDLRVISATHQDLDAMLRDGSFRTDLFARLSGFRLTLPPLRARREDLGILIGSILLAKMGSAAKAVKLEPAAIRALYRYHWPLNIRELENALGTAAVLAGAGPITVQDLPEQIRTFSPAESIQSEPGRPLSPEQEQQRAELIELLQNHQGNISAVARATGKARQQVHRWLKRYQLDPDHFRG